MKEDLTRFENEQLKQQVKRLKKENFVGTICTVLIFIMFLIK